MAHEEFEFAIERRRHGAVEDAQAHEALDRHLAECAACRSYDTELAAEDLGLAKMFSLHARDLDLNAVQARAERALRWSRRWPYLAPLPPLGVLALQLSVNGWAHGWWVRGWRSILVHVLIFAFFGGIAAIVRYSLSRSASLAGEARFARIGALRFCRETLDASIAHARLAAWLLPSGAVAIAGLSWCIQDRESALASAILVPFFLAAAGWFYFFRLPRLRRERQELA